MASGIRVRVVASNYAPGLLVLPGKVSGGALHRRPLDYYMEEYPRVKPGLVAKWAREAYRGFPSALEHVVFTFIIDGCSRVCSHQLVRHRLASYTQESMRYSESYLRAVAERACRAVGVECAGYGDYHSALQLYLREAGDPESLIETARVGFVLPPEAGESVLADYARAYLSATAAYYGLLERGARPETARYVVPMAVRTRVLVTMNLRELLHFLSLRTSPAAQAEMRLVACLVKDAVARVAGEVAGVLEEASECSGVLD